MHLVSGEDQLALLAVPFLPRLRTLGSAETQLTGYVKDTSFNPYLDHPRGDGGYCLQCKFFCPWEADPEGNSTFWGPLLAPSWDKAKAHSREHLHPLPLEK